MSSDLARNPWMSARPTASCADDHPESGQPRLTWVVVDGEVRHISAFANLPVGRRPVASCPQCARPAILKLGEKVAHHAAHRPGDQCAATAPETALHLNAKFHLAEQLRLGAPLDLEDHCATGEGCAAVQARAWGVAWDRVDVELPVGSRRPDITLFAGTTPVAAVEVFATHAVDAEKATVLAELELPWLEVRAHHIIRGDVSAWSRPSTLPVHREAPPSPWWCADCARRRADARWKRENGEFIRVIRLVDYYFPNGKKFRDVFTIVERRTFGVAVATLLRRRGNDYEDVVNAPPSAETMALLTRAYRRITESYLARGAIVDSPMRWVPADSVIFTSNLVVYGDFHYPRRYLWSDRNNRWFLMREHTNTRWDEGCDGSG